MLLELYIRAVWIIQSALKFNCQIPKNLDEAFIMPPKIGRLVEFHFLEFLKIILLLAFELLFKRRETHKIRPFKDTLDALKARA